MFDHNLKTNVFSRPEDAILYFGQIIKKFIVSSEEAMAIVFKDQKIYIFLKAEIWLP